jgi:RNA polymerase sigma-70 factor (ECF subfamily)
VKVNGQPGRLLRGPREPELGEAERLAAEKAGALLRSGDVDPQELAALMLRGRRAAGEQVVVQVWEVLSVDVVEGRIQTVRIVRNPDKLAHL